MELYGVIKFVHIVAGIVLVGFAATMYPLSALADRARDTATLQPTVTMMAVVAKVTPIAAVVTLLAGLQLAFTGDWWGQGWVVVSLVLFLAAGGIAGGYLDKHVKRIGAALHEAGPGPVPGEVRALLHAPGPYLMERLLTAIDVAIVFLMVTKPGYGPAVAVAAAWMLVAVGVARWSARRRTAAVRTAAAA